ncbi:hypothetical protein IW262DRAFT_1416316 [Armillaria fumosa]|nr:hypothetical protein IW262DRAFT_1416316 [Armillaria fumosa]
MCSRFASLSVLVISPLHTRSSMVAYIEVPFGTWAKEIGPEANIELLVGNDIMVLTNAALVNAQEGGRSSLKLTPVKKEGSANGNGGTLCSLIPHFIESVPLSVRLGRDETYIIENTGLSDITVIGHYVGQYSSCCSYSHPWMISRLFQAIYLFLVQQMTPVVRRPKPGLVSQRRSENAERKANRYSTSALPSRQRREVKRRLMGPKEHSRRKT